MKKVRLEEWQIKAIKECVKKAFGEGSKVILFGSRTDPKRKGGDIDIYVIPSKTDNLFKREIELRALLLKRLGERKIDIVLRENPDRPIEREAIEKGVEI